MAIIWCKVPEIWSMTDIIFCHSALSFALLPPYKPRKSKFWKNENNTWRYHFTNVHHKWQSYDVWFLRYRVRVTEFFVILDGFLLFYPPLDLKIQNFEKMKKPPQDIIILQMCNINDSHMTYGSWDTECDRKFFAILHYFLPFYPPNNPKNQSFEKMKKTLRDHYHFTRHCSS